MPSPQPWLAHYNEFAAGQALLGSTSGFTNAQPPGITTETWLGAFAGSGVNKANAPFSFWGGYQAGSGAVNADSSVFLGGRAGFGATEANNSIFMGVSAGESGINCAFSIFMGDHSGFQATDAAYSTFLGAESGYQAIGAYNSQFAGFQAGYQATDAHDSVFYGHQSGRGAATAANCLFMGYRSGFNDTIDTTVSGWAVLLGPNTNTGGFKNGIGIGAGVSNTMDNELYIADGVINVNIAGVHYEFPTVQGAAGTKLTNNGAGVLTWS